MEERKLVTALFADVTGSTELGERLDPERLRAILNAYFSAMASVIESWGGTVEKFIGDAVMAVFGVPAVREDDAERALRAALEMLERLEELNRGFRERHGVALGIRIGVNTGEVIAPAGGGGADRLVTGDAVNLAARLEQAAEPGTILVGERTYVATREAFRFDDPVDLDLKGKSLPVVARRVVGPRAEAIRGVPGLRSPMVGRDRELDALQALFEEALGSGRPRMVLVVGPAGIGKSRLVQEFGRIAQSARGAVLLRGRCLAAGHGITYWALGEILRELCGIGLGDPVTVAAAKLRTGVRDVLAPLDLPPENAETTTFALATTAGIALADNPLERLGPRAVSEELNLAWPRLATGLARRGPAILVIEDIHWAGDRLLEMLELLVSRSAGPLTVVATIRPEFADTHSGLFRGLEDASSISLRPLSNEQSGDLLEGLLEEADLPPSLRSEILDRAEGNPFFLEEIIRRLIDEGALVREGGVWRATPAAMATRLPDTVHALLAARIDALPLPEKRVLQEAAVIGRVFWADPLRSATNGEDLEAALLSLERKGLVLTRPVSSIAGQAEYSFKHVLIRDVAYAGLPKARRARAHADVGAWTKTLAGERQEEFAELIAHHLSAAVSGEEADLAWADDPSGRERVRVEAVGALLLSGSIARRRFAVSKAVDLHGEALGLAESPEERLMALEALGDDHEAVFHGEDAADAYLEAIELARGDPSRGADRARLCMKAARVMENKGGAFRVRRGPRTIEELAGEGLEAGPDEGTRGWLLAIQGGSGLWWPEGQDPQPFDQRVRWLEEAYQIGAAVGDARLQAYAYRTLEQLHELVGHLAVAAEMSRRQLPLLDRINDRSERAHILFWAGTTALELEGDGRTALELGGRSLELAAERSPHEVMHGTFTLIAAHHHLGQWDALMPVLDQHVARFHEEIGVRCLAVNRGPLLGALTLAHRGDTARARELMALVRLDRDEPDTLEGLHALCLLAVGEPDAGIDLAQAVIEAQREARQVYAMPALVEGLIALEDWDRLTEALPSAREVVWRATHPPLWDRAEGVAWAAAGRADEAAEALRRSVAEFDRLEAPFEAARSREALARVVDRDRAAELLREALDAYELLRAIPHAARARAALNVMG